MNFKTPTRATIATAAVAGIAAFAGGAVILGGDDSRPAQAAASDRTAALPPSSASTDEKIAAYKAIVAARPRVSAGYALLSSAYQQKSRESADPDALNDAIAVNDSGLKLASNDLALRTQRASLLLARHQFAAALEVAEGVHRADPTLRRPYGALVDALVEMGMYERAGKILQEAVDRGPGLGTYTRVSYFRELHGDIPGAIEALELAASSGGDAAENVAYVQTLRGNLLLASNRVRAAGRAYREALFRLPGYVPALVGLGRHEAMLGRFDSALPRLRGAVDRNASPESLTALVEAELASGSPDAAVSVARLRQTYIELADSGENAGVERGLFEAQHGDPELAVELARQGHRDAPSVRADDALAYALTRAARPREGLRYARRAVRLGTRDAAFLYRAAVTADAAGRPGLARTWLRRALERNPRFSPLDAPRARALLTSLGR